MLPMKIALLAATTEDSNSEGVSEGFDDNSNSEEVLSDVAYDVFIGVSWTLQENQQKKKLSTVWDQIM